MTIEKHSDDLSELIADHSRHWEDYQYVYPVISRRSRGMSIGINLCPTGVCNFDCVYCQVDREPLAEMQQEVDVEILRGELTALLKDVHSGRIWEHAKFAQVPAEYRRVNDIAFSGDGEPTAVSHFAKAVDIALKARERFGLDDVKIVVITNATMFHREQVVRALSLLDDTNSEIWAKLDAGSEGYYQRVSRSKVPLVRVLDNILELGRQRSVTIQTLLMKIDGQAMSDGEFQAYVQRLRGLRAQGCEIAKVQLYTVARQPAESSVGPISDEELAHYGHQLKAGLGGVTVETY